VPCASNQWIENVHATPLRTSVVSDATLMRPAPPREAGPCATSPEGTGLAAPSATISMPT